MGKLREFRSLSRERRRRVIVRYVLFQIPDGALILFILVLIRTWVDLPSWLFGLILGLWFLKDIVLFPFTWMAYKPPDAGDRRVVGSEGIVEQDLDPSGYVRVHGELWQARLARGHGPIEKGAAVKILEIHGLTLLVEPSGQQTGSQYHRSEKHQGISEGEE